MICLPFVTQLMSSLVIIQTLNIVTILRTLLVGISGYFFVEVSLNCTRRNVRSLYV